MKQVYEVREDKTMDWGKRLRYSVNYAKQPLHTLSSHASMSEGFAFRVARNEGNLGALSADRLAPSELLLLKLHARPQPLLTDEPKSQQSY
jgi:hypothetical protein